MGAVPFEALIGGFGWFALRSEDYTLSPEGIHLTQGGLLSGPIVAALEVQIDLEITQTARSGISRPHLGPCVDLVLDAKNEAGEPDTIRVFASA